MRKVKKKNILDRIDDSINDKIDEIKEKNREKKLNNSMKKNIKTIDTNKDNKNKTKKDVKTVDIVEELDDVKYDTFNEDKDSDGINIDENITLVRHNKFDKKKKFKSIDVTDDLDESLIDKKKKFKSIDIADDLDKTLNNKKKVKFNFFKKRKGENLDVDDKSTIEETEDIEDNIAAIRYDNKKKKKNDNRFDKKKVKIKNNKKKVIKDNDEKKKRKRPLWKKIITFFLILCIIGVLSVAAFLGYVVVTAPEFTDSALLIKDQTVIYDIDGNVIAKLGTEKRESVTYDALPQVLVDAIIATEDSRFFQHNGVDLFRFIKATIQQVMGHDDAGGASTLTMQTVKNNITKMDKKEDDSNISGKIKKVIRKFQDVYLAVFKIEKEYSKEEILEMYVNDNFLGGSYYGVEEASKYYFGKSVSDLTLPEASLIAGLFQAPGRHNPYVDIDKATARRTTVLKLMVRHGYITEEERKLAEKVSIESLLVGRNDAETKYQGYIDTVVAEVEKITDRGDGSGGDNPYTVPMKIYTTMERSIQDGVNAVFASNDPTIWRDDKVQGAVAIVNSETGGIAAIGSGRNRSGERQFNYATQAYRQPGSTAKPVFDYGPGVEYNNFSSYTLFMDEPWGYTNGPSIGNWDGKFEGLITARRALQVSRNIPALKAFQQVGAKNSQKFASSLGLNVSLNSSSENYEVYANGVDNTINEAYAIGGVAKGFTPLNMATAYACFSNGGYYIESHTVTKIIYRETGEEKEFKYTKERVMKDSTAYIINNMLESAVTGGFSGGANTPGSHVAAKTGTSNYDTATMQAKGLPGYAINDLWTVAYTSKYSYAVWYGYDDIDPQFFNYEDGKKNHLTAAIAIYIPKDPVGWAMPSSVVVSAVERETWPAALPSEFTPADMRTSEVFVRGTQPTEVSERYQRLNDIKNYKVSKNGNSATITWEYDMPKFLTQSFLESYFNKPTFGNSKGTMVSGRMNYNNVTLGEVGYAIYRQQSDGSLTLVDFVTDKSYTYTGYGDTTLVIKAEHRNFKSNASNGIKFNLSLDDLNVNNIVATFYSSGSIQATVGNYEEKGFKSITYGGVDISKNVTIKYSISGGSETFNTPTEFEAHVNTLPAGTYTITYTITYLGTNVTKTRKLILS